MPQILVEALAKTYRVAERAPGLAGALRGLVSRRWREVHALAGVSFSLDAVRAKIEVLFSTNLVEWQQGAPHLEPVSTEPLGDGRALVTWRVKPPLRDEPQVFMRLRVTAQ